MNQEAMGLLERGVSALERLAQDPEIQIETGPPVCPHCQTMNPNVRVSESDEEGRMAEFIIKAYCTSCNKFFYAIPMNWECVQTQDEAGQVMEMKVRASGLDSREN